MTRRRVTPTGHTGWRWVKRAAWLSAGLISGAFAAVTLFVYQAPKPPRFPPRKTPADEGVRYRDIALSTIDGIPLKGWWCPARGNLATVILCHGYPGSRADIRPLIPFLHRAGYNVLAFDFRRLGASGGDRCTIGLLETRDLRAAVDEAERRSPAPIAVLGVSMGGAVSIMEAADDPRVRAVVADSAYASLDEQVRRRTTQMIPGPGSGVLGVWAEWLGCRVAGQPLSNASPLRVVHSMAPRPILLIHCAGDRVVPPTASQRLYEAAGKPKSLWLVPDGGHILAYRLQPGEYERRVTAFLRGALQDDHRLPGAG